MEVCKCEKKTVNYYIPAFMGKPRVSVPRILVVRKCEECEDSEFAELVVKLTNDRAQRARPKAPPEAFNYVWVTINPKPDIQLNTFIKKIEQVLKYKWCIDYWYSLEQRSSTDTERGSGLHTHILIQIPLKKRIPDIRAQLWKSLELKFIGTKKHLHIVTPREIKLSPDQFKKDKLDYLQGNKWDPEKEDKILQDRIWREENNILPLYTKCRMDEDIPLKEETGTEG